MTTHSSVETSGEVGKGHAKGQHAKEHGSEDAVTVRVREGIAVIVFDVPGEKQNTLSERSSEALRKAFERLSDDPALKGAVLISGKADFIAGADISMMQHAKSAADCERLSRNMQEQLFKIERSAKPVVAAIHGAALGGGLEVALACHYRIATDSPKTVFALPEVMLGLLPGGGGTQRLPALIGIANALDMMLTGKNIRVHKAKEMGLVDTVTGPYGLEDAAVLACQRLIRGEISSPAPVKKKTPGAQAMHKVLEDNPAGRAILFRQARAQVMEKTGGLYPAPLAILDVVALGVASGLGKGASAGYAAESKCFGELAMSPQAGSLMALFFGQTALKKNRFGKSKVQASTVGVLGAGLMGSGIAEVTAAKGVRVLMKDVSPESLARGQKAIYGAFDKRSRSRAITSFERDRTFNLVVPKLDYVGFENCELVIEAVFEDLALKQRMIKELEEQVSPSCIIASNTSALPLKQIAQGSKRPENIVGMHYFSPVPKMPLLEVIVTPVTSKEAASLAVEVGIQQGKTVIVVKDGPGFYTSRILGPLMEEAALCALEGIDLHVIDNAMKAWGFPVGPITLLDEVGIDVAAHVAKDMAPFFELRFGPSDSRAFEAMVEAGYLGRKSGKGFFVYERSKQGPVDRARKIVEKAMGAGAGSGKPLNPGALAVLAKHGAQPGSKKLSDEDILQLQLRIGLRLVNEAVQCLQEGILESPVDGDIGAVFGLGFPPARGGPFRSIDIVGASTVTSTLERFASTLGKRFKPADLLVEKAKRAEKFHTTKSA